MSGFFPRLVIGMEQLSRMKQITIWLGIMAVVSDGSQFSIYEFRVHFFKGSVLGFEEEWLLFYDVNV